MGWHCVLIEHERLGYPLDVTFRHMLMTEFQMAGEPADCRVYGRERGPGTYIYYFSPGAYKAMKAFVDFWDGYECHERNTAQAGLEVII
jgi:hypothetical protein